MSKKNWIGRSLRSLMVLTLASLLLAGNAMAALSQAEKTEIGIEMTKLFRAARGVIAKNQGLINDASKGDKGLSAEKVIAAAKSNYKAASGSAFTQADKSTTKGEAQAAMLAAIGEVMDNAQALINEKGKGLKGFLPAIFAKQTAS